MASSVLPVPVGPAKRKTATGLVAIGEPGLQHGHAIDDGIDGFVLANHACAEETAQLGEVHTLAVVEYLLRHASQLRHRSEHVGARDAAGVLREGALHRELQQIEHGAGHLTRAQVVTGEIRHGLERFRFDAHLDVLIDARGHLVHETAGLGIAQRSEPQQLERAFSRRDAAA